MTQFELAGDYGEFVSDLIDGTEAGDFSWQETDTGFQASKGGLYIVKIRSTASRTGGPYDLVAERLNGEVIVAISQSSADREMAMAISYLADLAQRNASPAAPELRNIIRELRGR